MDSWKQWIWHQLENLSLLLSWLSCFLSTHVSFWHFFYTGPSSVETIFSSLPGSMFKPSPFTKMIITPHFPPHTLFHWTDTIFIMADQLPLAKLSIQNKMGPPAENMQPIKTKKAHPSNPATLHHPCSLDTLTSLTNKWSAMTHPLQATVMGFNGMTILYGHYYFHQDWVVLTHAFATSTTATTV